MPLLPTPTVLQKWQRIYNQIFCHNADPNGDFQAHKQTDWVVKASKVAVYILSLSLSSKEFGHQGDLTQNHRL